MKNQHFQNNMILSIVAVVLSLIGVAVIYFNRPQPVSPGEPTKVPPVTVAVPANLVQKTPGLPGGGDNNNQGAAAGAGNPGLPGGGAGAGAPGGAGGKRTLSASPN